MQLYQLLQRYLWLSGCSSRREWWIVHIACLLALTINDQIFFKPVTGGRTAPTEMNQAE